MPVRIRPIDRVVPRVRIPIRSDAFLVGVPPVGGDEAGDGGVVIAGVEVEEAGLGVGAFADEALAFRLGA